MSGHAAVIDSRLAGEIFSSKNRSLVNLLIINSTLIYDQFGELMQEWAKTTLNANYQAVRSVASWV